MTDLLDAVRESLKPREADNRLVPLIASGAAPVSVFGLMAAEESHIVPSDWRAFLTLSARASEPNARQFFAALATGEGLALPKLPALAAAGGFDSAALAAYEPMAGCQAYPSFVAWLALNAEPADVVIAMSSNFAAWGGYCAAITSAMRSEYGLGSPATAFFDFFAGPAPELEELAAAAVDAAVESGSLSGQAPRYARLFQSYELMFWNTIADAAHPAS
jgi:hypothetical protein